MFDDPRLKGEKVSAGRILVVGSQGGGKTAMATRLASRSDSSVEYKEEFGGTIETEYLKVNFEKNTFFALLLPIGGQEKWSNLRKAYGETAESLIAVIDSTTKIFWPSSIKQAYQISSQIPYDEYPIGVCVTKRDLNEIIKKNIDEFTKIIVEGFEKVKEYGLQYYSRGFKVIKREIPPLVNVEKIPFSIAEQIIVNALENKYFDNVDHNNPNTAVMKLKGMSLVNVRLFSRALATTLSQGGGEDQSAVLALLNDMRPTLLELDSSWDSLIKKYPKAGNEPWIKSNFTEEEIKVAIIDNLLAKEEDIEKFSNKINELKKETGWKIAQIVHASTFSEEGLDEISLMVKDIMLKINKSKPDEKFLILDPLETIF